MVHEAIHSIRVARMAKILLKLDIQKAYEKVCWNFLFATLRKFGFCDEWIVWVKSCVCTPRFFVLVNGSSRGFFEASRGLRHGDPLSPFLFIIMVEVLGHLITKK